MEMCATFSRTSSRSFSIFCCASASRADTSTGLCTPEVNALLSCRIGCAYLAAPKGFDLGAVAAGLGEARGEGAVEFDEERGRSSSLRRPICGVGGVELLASLTSIRTQPGKTTRLETYATWSCARLSAIPSNHSLPSQLGPRQEQVPAEGYQNDYPAARWTQKTDWGVAWHPASIHLRCRLVQVEEPLVTSEDQLAYPILEKV